MNTTGMNHPATSAARKRCAIKNSLSFFAAPSTDNAAPCASAAFQESPGTQVALELKDWTARIFYSMPDTPQDWDEMAPGNDIFLQRAFLTAVENCPPQGMAFAYIIFYHQEKPAGIAYGQLLDLRIKKSLEASLSRRKGVWNSIKSLLAGLGRFQMLICGNMLLTGAHGFHFRNQHLKEPAIAALLDGAFKATAGHFRRGGRKVDLFMVKDINPCCKGVSDALAGNGFSDFSFQPNMKLQLHTSWKSIEDYLEAMSSKYRIRARRAFKKREGLIRRELNAHMTELESPAMYALYKEVAAHADFNPFELHPDYFHALKKTFPKQFRVFAYYSGDELMGFYTTMRNNDNLEAHFLGFRDDANNRRQLYLNMLYDMVGTAIEEGVSELVFARTAMEIKSSVGAEPEQLDCRLRHNHGLSNRLMPFFIRLLEPNAEWVQRHPFR